MKVVALAGGVGGAKLADGLAQCLPGEDLSVIVNTGDDFEFLGLRISPDVDTVCYALSGMENPVTGWGQRDETWNAYTNLVKLGGPDWFHLGDKDLGIHLERTRRLAAGQSLSQITGEFCREWGIGAHVLPMSDDSIPTLVQTIELGELPFQNYFVEHQCQPRVTSFRFKNIEKARPAEGVLEVIKKSDLIVICPSNPWVSIGPILQIPGVREAVSAKYVLAVSPIIGGEAVKGPAAKMYRELGMVSSALTVARHYGNILTGFVIDRVDAELTGAIRDAGIIPLATDTLMKDRDDRRRLAAQMLDFGTEFGRRIIIQ
jgi:LPPG:FO 2-phospho-L-lactate transferase